MFYWYTAKYKNFEICRILLISSRFPEVLDTLARVTVDFFARDAFVRTNRHAIAVMFVRPSVCLQI